MRLSDAGKSYNGFERPVACFKVNDKQLSGRDLIYKDIRVTLTAGMEASDCQVEIMGRYTRFEAGGIAMDRSFSELALGAKLEVLLGYGRAENAESVFVGYISALEYEIKGGDVSLFVTAMDCKQFMMNSFRSVRKKDIKKYSEAVNEVLGQYSALCSGTEVETSPEVLAPVEQHNQSDYDFVASLARRLNYLFYVVAGKVYFISYSKYTNSVLTVQPGRELHWLRREVTLAKQVKSVTVRNHNAEDADKSFESKASAVKAVGGGKTAGADSSRVITEAMSRVVTDNSVRSEAEARARAEALLGEISMGFLTGTMEIAGLPPVIPGRMVTVEKFGKELDRDYFITRVVHHMDLEGYETTISFAGNKM